jgi:hypothetical protein
VTTVTRASTTDTYAYDLNGNPSTSSGQRMTCRIENGEWFEQSYNAETCTEPVEVTVFQPSPNGMEVAQVLSSNRGAMPEFTLSLPKKW